MQKAAGKRRQNGSVLSKSGHQGLHTRCGSWLLLLPGEGNQGLVPPGSCARTALLWAAGVGNSNL